jgi:hypothetical protein
VPLPDHTTGLKHVFSFLREKMSATIVEDVKAVGHRIVHGGHLASSAVLDSKAKAEINRAAMFAPLHNPANLKGLEASEAFFPGRAQVGYDCNCTIMCSGSMLHRARRPPGLCDGARLQGQGRGEQDRQVCSAA